MCPDIRYISQLRTVSKLAVSGAITIVAGTGTLGSGGDGGKATSAELSNVLGLAVDHQGNLYLSDQNNQRIRKVSPDGTITTIAGTTPSYSAFPAHHPVGDLPAHLIGWPTGLAVDKAGNLYFAYTPPHEAANLRKYYFSNAFAVLHEKDAAGNLYVLHPWSFDIRIMKRSPDGTVTKFAGK